jgi:cytoskeletal protein CcmA (bactofilin family)
MFSKSNDLTPPSSAPQPFDGFGKSVLASDLVITGDVLTSSTVEVSGTVNGMITAKSLIIGVDGQVSGKISAENVDVRGKFDGTLATQSLALRSSCDVQGEMVYATLSIESGAVVEGQFKVTKL